MPKDQPDFIIIKKEKCKRQTKRKKKTLFMKSVIPLLGNDTSYVRVFKEPLRGF